MLVGVVREMLLRAPGPRNVLVRFRLGQVFGEADDADRQRAVLADALAALFTMRRPGEIVELPYVWKLHASRFPALYSAP